LPVLSLEAGRPTWLRVARYETLVIGQKIDFSGQSGVEVLGPDGRVSALQGTYLVGTVQADSGRVLLLDAVSREPLATRGSLDAAHATVSTYRLVGPAYFLFFAGIMAAAATVFVLVATRVAETTHLRDEAGDIVGA